MLEEPVIRVVRGRPTAPELAALVCVLTRRTAPAAPAPTAARWASSARPGLADRPVREPWRAGRPPGWTE